MTKSWTKRTLFSRKKSLTLNHRNFDLPVNIDGVFLQKTENFKIFRFGKQFFKLSFVQKTQLKYCVIA